MNKNSVIEELRHLISLYRISEEDLFSGPQNTFVSSAALDLTQIACNYIKGQRKKIKQILQTRNAR